MFYRYCLFIGLNLLLLYTKIKAHISEETTTTIQQQLPYFNVGVQRNLTVTVGQTGFLHCKVEQLGDKDVSWIRKRDLHILTAGVLTYTSDQRFQVIHHANSIIWTLQIKYPQPRDSGVYECQVNTEPKMSLSYIFNVIELKANILGQQDLFLKSGSDINLQCKISQGPHDLGNIFWYKGNDILEPSNYENDIFGDTEQRITVNTEWTNGLTSRLKINSAAQSDSGNYTCVPTIAKSSSVYVHVISGEHPAAMQHNSSLTPKYIETNLIFLIIFLFLVNYTIHQNIITKPEILIKSKDTAVYSYVEENQFQIRIEKRNITNLYKCR